MPFPFTSPWRFALSHIPSKVPPHMSRLLIKLLTLATSTHPSLLNWQATSFDHNITIPSSQLPLDLHHFCNPHSISSSSKHYFRVHHPPHPSHTCTRDLLSCIVPGRQLRSTKLVRLTKPSFANQCFPSPSPSPSPWRFVFVTLQLESTPHQLFQCYNFSSRHLGILCFTPTHLPNKVHSTHEQIITVEPTPCHHLSAQ